jgi:NADH dehydrogenase FAD-containing subunit
VAPQGGAVTRAIVLGGGFGGVAAARHLAKSDDLEVLLLSRTNFLTYTPFLADVAGGTLAVVHAVPPIRMMAPRARVEVAEVRAVDISSQSVLVTLPDGSSETREFDYLVIALGAVTNFRHGAGSAEFGLPLYSVADAFVLRNHVLEMLELAEASDDPAERRELLTFVFCGGGFSGVEGAAAVRDLVHGARRYFKTIRPDEPRFVLAPHGDRLLAQIDEKLGEYVVRRLTRRSVEVKLGVGVTDITARAATLSTGEVVPTRTVLWAAGIEVNPLLQGIDLPKDEHGALKVGGDLRVDGHDNVFALGDCAAVPKTGGAGFYAPTAQNAIREGPVVARNLLSVLHGERPERLFDYKPVGSLASLGHREAVAQVKGVKISGFLAWLMWRGVYLGKLPRFSRKFQVAVDWLGDLFSPVETTYFPLGPVLRAERERGDERSDMAA